MKKIRYTFIIVVGLFFYSILLASSIRNIYFSDDGGKGRLGFLAKPFKFLAETPSLIKKVLEPEEFFVTNTVSGNGFTYINKKQTGKYPKLLVSYKEARFAQTFDLLDINDGRLIKRWLPDNKHLYQKAYNEENPRKPSKGSDLHFMHPLMTKDSSLLITSQLTSLLAKIDKNSNLLWLKNDRIYHHTLEVDEEENIYVCTQPFVSDKYDFLPGNFETYKSTLQDDHITILNKETGKEVFSKSVIGILLENGYESLLLSKGQIISDQIHLNDIQPALSNTEYWEKGDLLVSCRNLSTVFLYRPATNKILWLQHGPWYNQHDVDFYGSDKIVIFGNDVIREESKSDPRITNKNLSFNAKRPNNEIYVYDFSNDSVATPYRKLMQTERIQTITSGRCDILENGDLFIEETNQGRIIIGDSTTKKIEYVKRLDQDHISSLFWSRIVN